nr:DMT family transporter [Solimonas fluminis]
MACGIAAGALWGLVFVAPEVASSFSPMMLAAGRYLTYGLFAVALILPAWRRLAAGLAPRDWLTLAWLSLLGNTLYYVLLANAVQLGGVAMTSLVIGFLPVAVTIIGSRDQGAVPLRRLAPSLLLSAAGVLCIGAETLGKAGAESGGGQRLLGLLCAFGALASWTSFAVGNSRQLARLDRISSHDWSLLIGVVTGVQGLLLLLPALLLETGAHTQADWLRYGAVCAGLALLSSIVGNGLWNQASRLLPLTMVGQMILFETLFALLYGFLWEQRGPTLLESLAVGLVLASVLSCLAAHRPSARITTAITAGHE